MAALSEPRRRLGHRARAVRPRGAGRAALGRRADARQRLRRAAPPSSPRPRSSSAATSPGSPAASGCGPRSATTRPTRPRPRAATLGRRAGATRAGRRPRCRGAASTSARRSTTAGRASSTSPARCRRPAATGCRRQSLAEIAELVWASGGRTLGLFSSRRAAETAAVHVRKQLPKLTILCQGDAQLSELTRRFVAEEKTSLFGTLSLWQGVDVPGRDLPAGDHRPDPVPASRRAADPGPAAGGRRGRRQRLHERGRHPRRPAARPGIGPADPPAQRPRAWSRCSTRGWSPPATARSCRPRCPTCGRPPTARSPSRRCAGFPGRPERNGRAA